MDLLAEADSAVCDIRSSVGLIRGIIGIRAFASQIHNHSVANTLITQLLAGAEQRQIKHRGCKIVLLTLNLMT
jgi:hypothetical protein